MEWSHRPIIFDHNRITRSYIGGKLLNAWRGMPEAEDNHQCEELLVTANPRTTPSAGRWTESP